MATSFLVPENCEFVSPLDAAARRTIRALHIINGEHYAGAERVQDLLALRLPEFGCEVGFACMKLGRFPELRQAREAPLYETAMRSRLDFDIARRVAAIVRREQYDLIHTHTARSALIGRLAAAIARVPMIHHVHSPASADTTHRWRNRINAFAERLTLSGATALVAVSQSMADHARRTAPRATISLVPNGVPVRGPLLDREPPSGTWVLGMAALFRPRKGLEVLLDALAALRANGTPVRLRAVGTFETEDYRQQIDQQVEKLGLADAIDWRGFQQDINRELAAMDLFVLPSLFGEGLPMVVLEAMAAGVPVIATRVTGTPEAIRDEVDGLVVEPGDAPALAHAIKRMVSGEVDWSALRASAHARHAERFSDRRMASDVARIYQEVLDGHR